MQSHSEVLRVRTSPYEFSGGDTIQPIATPHTPPPASPHSHTVPAAERPRVPVSSHHPFIPGQKEAGLLSHTPSSTSVQSLQPFLPRFT